MHTQNDESEYWTTDDLHEHKIHSRSLCVVHVLKNAPLIVCVSGLFATLKPRRKTSAWWVWVPLSPTTRMWPRSCESIPKKGCFSSTTVSDLCPWSSSSSASQRRKRWSGSSSWMTLCTRRSLSMLAKTRWGNSEESLGKKRKKERISSLSHLRFFPCGRCRSLSLSLWEMQVTVPFPVGDAGHCPFPCGRCRSLSLWEMQVPVPVGDAGHCPFGKARCDGCPTQGKYLILDVAISEDLFLGVFRKKMCACCVQLWIF